MTNDVGNPGPAYI